MVHKLIDGLCRLFGLLMVACLAAMVVMVFGNVVLRYGFNSGITISEELSRWLFVWMTFLGAVVAVRSHGHLGTDFLVGRLPHAGRLACFIVARLLMLALCVLMVRGAWLQTQINMGTTSAVMPVPVAWLTVSGVVFGVLAAAILVLELVDALRGQLSDEQLASVAESEDVPAHAEPASSLRK